MSNEHVHRMFQPLLNTLTPAQRTDAELGMAWWNGLDEDERAEWMERAGNTGVAADAWKAYKNDRDNQAEAAYERSLGECFRGGEYAAWLAAEQAEARKLK